MACIFLPRLSVCVSSMTKKMFRSCLRNKLRSMSSAIVCITCDSLQQLRQRNSPVIRSASRASQGFGQAFYSAPMTYGDSQNQRPKVSLGSLGERASKWPEKTLQLFGYFADSNHTASPVITCCSQKCYRLSRPFLFDNCYYQNPKNRSV